MVINNLVVRPLANLTTFRLSPDLRKLYPIPETVLHLLVSAGVTVAPAKIVFSMLAGTREFALDAFAGSGVALSNMTVLARLASRIPLLSALLSC